MMPSIPLPFVISMLLVILLARLISQREPSLRPAIVFVGACALLTTIVGLRWSFDVGGIRFLQPVIASSLPPIAWFCFSGLAEPGNAARQWIHAIPFGVIAILSAIWPRWDPLVDVLLAVVFLGYGIAMLRLVSGGPDGLAATRLSDAAKACKATLLAGLLLTSSGVVDLLVALDFNFYEGAHAAVIVGIASMVTLPLIATAVAIVGKSVSAPEASDRPTDEARPSGQSGASNVSTEDDAQIVEVIDTIMRKKKLFRDPDLTLSRLSRKAGIPSRQISTAINRVFGRNVSQVVNEYRIEEAKTLLVQSDMPITAILFEAGFQTKSNFNREFLRVAGMSPSDYRRSGSDKGGPISVGSPLPERR